MNDHDNLMRKMPGLQKLRMLKEVVNALKVLPIQEKFLENDGCRYLAEWLDLLPDNNYPNFNLVHDLLSCIQNLRIDAGHL